MLRIEMLPAAQGDALFIQYGDDAHPRRMLVDGGTKSSWPDGLRARIEGFPKGERHFELLVVTHIDADHIEGALALLRDEDLGASFGDVWFNGWRHLPETSLESLGPVDGELLTETLVDRNIPWNDAFNGRAVGVNPEGKLPQVDLDGLKLTVLSPTAKELAELKPLWTPVVKDAGLAPGEPATPTEPEEPPTGLESLGPGELPDVEELASVKFKADTAEANGSTIALLLEHEGKSAVLCGDAFPAVVAASVDRLLQERDGDRLKVDAFKLPHHGSHANISLELLRKLDCPAYLFSSNGSKTKHPHPEAVARVLVADEDERALFFNYRSRYSEMWSAQELQDEHGYEATYPEGDSPGLAVDI